MRVLIVKMSALGDIVHAFPVLQYIKNLYPESKIDWVVEKSFADLVQAHPLVDRVLTIQTKQWRKAIINKTTWHEIRNFIGDLRQSTYEVVLDLQGNIKSGLVTFFAKSVLKVGFGYASVPEWPNILVTHKRYNPPKQKNIREDYLFLAQKAFNPSSNTLESAITLNLTQQEKTQLLPLFEQCQQTKKLKVMVCPGSNWSNKQLSKETLLHFLNCFTKKMDPQFLFLWGNQAEKILVEELMASFIGHSIVIDKMSLPSLQNLMRHVDLIVAMDSLPLHLAGTTTTPTFSIFGASAGAKYAPLGSRHRTYQGSCPFGKKFEKRCDILRTCQSGACVKNIEGEQLFEYFHKWWVTHNM